jgi:hypothetical protein
LSSQPKKTYFAFMPHATLDTPLSPHPEPIPARYTSVFLPYFDAAQHKFAAASPFAAESIPAAKRKGLMACAPALREGSPPGKVPYREKIGPYLVIKEFDEEFALIVL